MKWNGEKIKQLLDDRNITVSSLATSVTVTRQTVHNWLNGSLPKGQDILKLCDFFKVNADAFFTNQDSTISLIAHRTHRRAVTTTAKDEAARKLASQFLLFFKKARPLGIVPALPEISNDKSYIYDIAENIRKISEIDNSKPMTYKAAFKLLKELGIFTVFCDFPSDLKSYAFFCMIENHRVVFIDSKTNVLDLIFQVLHETIHAIRTEKIENYTQEEEDFCDSVACLAQFPESYVKVIIGEIRSTTPARTIQILKDYAYSNGHSMHGLLKAIKAYTNKDLSNRINIYPAEKEIHDKSPSINKILFDKNEPDSFWKRLQQLSPHFANEIKTQHKTTSIRKVAEQLGLPTTMDAQGVIDEMVKSEKE